MPQFVGIGRLFNGRSSASSFLGFALTRITADGMVRITADGVTRTIAST